MASLMPRQREGPPAITHCPLPSLRQLLSNRGPGDPLDVQPMLNSQSLPSISHLTSVDSTYPTRRPPLHPGQNLNVLNAPAGFIDVHQSPFLSQTRRPMGSDPATSQPALPTPLVGQRTYFTGVPITAPTPPSSMGCNGLRRPSMSFSRSGSASPITQFSLYSQPTSETSSQYEAPNQHGGYMPALHNPQIQESQHAQRTMETERSRASMTPTGQSSIQIMAIKSLQGHDIRIPVDVQSGSKVSDKKRKRNAGASARLRERQKEKERLETRLREALEDAEYYKSECDHLTLIVSQQLGAKHDYTRPPSPRLRRVSVVPSNAPSSEPDHYDNPNWAPAPGQGCNNQG